LAFHNAVGIRFFPPQYLTLLELSRLTLDDLHKYILNETKRTNIEPTMPEPHMTDEGPVLLLPGDALHSTATHKALSPGAMQRVKLEVGEKGISGIKLIERAGTTAKSNL
jgi:hypothetical protein